MINNFGQPRLNRGPASLIARGLGLRGRRGLIGVVAAASIVAFAGAAPQAVAGTEGVEGERDPFSSCPSAVEPGAFASTAEIEKAVSTVAGFGLRMPASTEHNNLLEWIESSMQALPGVRLSSQSFKMTRWQATTPASGMPGRDLGAAGQLAEVHGSRSVPIPTAGAMAFSRPTGGTPQRGRVVFVPSGMPITAKVARGKIVVRDFSFSSIPYSLIAANSAFVSPGFVARLSENYERPFTADQLRTDTVAAAQAGAVGIVQAFDVPTRQVRGYFDPHEGQLQHIPGVYVGVEGREALRRIARQRGTASIAVNAEIDRRVPTRNVIATIPGQSAEKISLITNTDGNTWVQENSVAALMVLAQYFADLPMSCRPKTIEFAFTSAHLAYVWDGVPRYAQTLTPDNTSFVFVVEHLGTREILPVDVPGPGSKLVLTGEHEPYAWFAPTESPALTSAISTAISQLGLDDTAVLRGLDVPSPSHVPTNCSYGGLGTFTHSQFIPTIAGISGPWSLWAPSFGKQAVDFDHMRTQTLAVANAVLALDDLSGPVIDGLYPAEEQLHESGVPGCDLTLPSKVAPR